MILNFLPKFKYIEVNDLVGLRNGHMLAQSPAAAGIAKVQAGNGQYFIENGILMGLGSDGKLKNYATGDAAMFLHYTEELNVMLDSLEYFAVPVETDGDTYPRAIALYIGDTFTTTNYSGTLTGDAGFAKIVNGVPTVQDAADKDSAFIAKKTLMPNGDAAVELQFYKVPSAE